MEYSVLSTQYLVPNPIKHRASGIMTIQLHQLATARSGDKGNHANIGVVARDAAAYEVLVRELTAELVAEFFAELGATKVERFELPNVQALNFVLYNALAGGASRSLRTDTQGKLLGTAILEMQVPKDDNKQRSGTGVLPVRHRRDACATGEAESTGEDWKE